LFNASLVLCQELDQRESIVRIQHNLAHIELKQGNYRNASQLFCTNLATLRRLGNRPAMIDCLAGLASVLSAQGQWEPAARLFGATQRFRRERHMPMAPAEQADFDCYKFRTQEMLGEVAFRKAWEQGEAMSWEKMVDYAVKLAGARERG
jgi:ATP/maltotriose-dependent transcriptional regulator MalT